MIPDELTPEEDLKKKEAEAKLLSETENKMDEETKKRLREEVKDGIKDLKVNEKGEGPIEGWDTNKWAVQVYFGKSSRIFPDLWLPTTLHVHLSYFLRP